MKLKFCDYKGRYRSCQERIDLEARQKIKIIDKIVTEIDNVVEYQKFKLALERKQRNGLDTNGYSHRDLMWLGWNMRAKI